MKIRKGFRWNIQLTRSIKHLELIPLMRDNKKNILDKFSNETEAIAGDSVATYKIRNSGPALASCCPERNQRTRCGWIKCINDLVIDYYYMSIQQTQTMRILTDIHTVIFYQ